MPNSKIDINALGQAFDTTFGRSSTPKTSSYSVKASFVGENLLSISYAAVVNFGNEREMIELKRRYEDEARKIIDLYLKHIKETYKELSGGTLKLTKRDAIDSVEITSMNFYNPKRQAYYRSKCLVEIN